MTDLVMEKAAARKQAFARRKTAHGAGLDASAQAELLKALDGQGDRALAGYMPIRTEVSPLPIMAGWTAPVGVPVILGEGQPLEFHVWTPDAEMVAGPFGASVPATAKPMRPEVVIVPLVAFTADGYRLGYGGGFYDRTLEKLRALGPVLAVGFAYGAQEADALPLEPTDQRLDALVTETGTRWFGA